MSALDRSLDIGESFLQRTKTLLQILNNLAQRHPTVSILCSSFKIIISLEMTRRTNDPEVFALLLRVQDMLTVFVQLFTLVNPVDQLQPEGDYNASLAERFFGVITSMHDDMANCSKLCSQYYAQTSIRKIINQGKFHNKFKDMGHQFEERRRNLEMVLLLAASTRLATDPAPIQTNTPSSSNISSSSALNKIRKSPGRAAAGCNAARSRN
ncbi:hypothetical protein C8R45DRAFT_373395 [Mycena sanguinolenta]|nr:hypothetical protein C8R45DRAFT_373395 [Mycena sanguinolenta]